MQASTEPIENVLKAQVKNNSLDEDTIPQDDTAMTAIPSVTGWWNYIDPMFIKHRTMS